MRLRLRLPLGSKMDCAPNCMTTIAITIAIQPIEKNRNRLLNRRCEALWVLMHINEIRSDTPTINSSITLTFVLKVCSHLTFASTSLSKFNIASM